MLRLNLKTIGILLIVLGLIVGLFTIMFKVREDGYIDLLVEENDSCFLDDGTCLHDDRNFIPYFIAGIVSGLLVLIGIYLLFADKFQNDSLEKQEKIVEAIKSSKEDDKFQAFLEGFTDDERAILKAVKNQDGIKQSTLRYKTGISKSSLSLILKHLEKREFISRKDSGKTKQVFLRNRF